MNKPLLILAIHTKEKANILKNILGNKAIDVKLEKVEQPNSDTTLSEGYYVKIKEADLTKALNIIEEYRLFNYDDSETLKNDDGRKRILVAIDFSDYSLRACEVAFNIAKEINAKVKILHVYHNVYFPSHFPFADNLQLNPDDGILDKTRKQMLDLCVDIDQRISLSQWPSVNYSYSLREGIVNEEIENFVEEYKPTLLVVGTKGESNDPSTSLGNVTTDVIEMVDTPVLTIPEFSTINNIEEVRHIVFLTSLQRPDLQSFKSLVDIVKLYNSFKITLLHITSDSVNKKLILKSLSSMSLHLKELYPYIDINHELIESSDISFALNSFIDREHVSVVSLNVRKRGVLARIFSPSFIREIFGTKKMILALRG